MNVSSRLGDVCEFKYGKGLPQSERRPGSVAVYGSNGQVGSHDNAVTDGRTIIIGRKGSIGEVNFSDAPCWPIDTTYFVDRSCTKVDLRWLYHALGMLGLTKLNKGAAVPGLNRDDAYERRLWVPPTEREQQRIAAILDKADAIRRKRRKALAEIDSLLRSIFLDMFGDPRANTKSFRDERLGDVCDFFAGSTLPVAAEFRGQDGGALVIKVAELNMLENLEVVRVARGWSPLNGRRDGIVAPAGAVVFPKRGGAISTNKKRVLGRNAYLDPNLMAVAPKDENRLSSEYLRAWFELFDLESLVSGSAVPQLNKRDLAPLRIIVPPKRLMHSFGRLSEFGDGLRRRTAIGHDAAEALFGSLSQRAFRGEL